MCYNNKDIIIDIKEVNILAGDIKKEKSKKGGELKFPEYIEAKVKCACGNEFTTMSTRSVLSVDICSKCHPFFTGKQKFVDSGGRVEKFNKRFMKSQNTSEC